MDTANANAYRLTNGSHARWEGTKLVRYHAGEIIRNITHAELTTHGHRLVFVSGVQPTATATGQSAVVVPPPPTAPTPTPAAADPWAAVLEGTAVSVVEVIEGLTSLDDVVAILTAESSASGKQRKGVIRSAESRIAELAAGAPATIDAGTGD